jgi:transcriptional antiterminator NusG
MTNIDDLLQGEAPGEGRTTADGGDPAELPAPDAASSEGAASVEGAEPGPDAASDSSPKPRRKPARKPEVAPAAAPETEAEGQWYAIRVQSNKEDSVKRAMERKIELRGLGRKITQVVVPTEKVAEIKNGRKRTRQVKTYPGYVLVQMLMDDETWSFVREIHGVGDFVGGGGSSHQKPFPLLPEEVAKIFGQDVPGEETPRIQIDFSRGDKVKIREGPFENFDGVVDEINEEKGLVRVVVTIFGRATPVELQYWQVEAI